METMNNKRQLTSKFFQKLKIQNPTPQLKNLMRTLLTFGSTIRQLKEAAI